jgi:hypothetical protein
MRPSPALDRPRSCNAGLEGSNTATIVGSVVIGYLRMFTARARTRPTVIRGTADWIIIIILAQREDGKVSVGLNAVALVNER